ncbi:MAG TPA: sugar ABC transporter substrate-binding protein [Actinomycetes bacterium]|nr:sugar ABC transporter substrate-binding protein [Actinomycetes bacterium]
MNRTKRLIVVAALVTLTLGACTSDDDNQASQTTSPAGGQGGDITIAVVTHGSAGDAFWDVVKNGAEAAGRDLGVTVNYQSNGDPAQQSQLIDAAVSQGVDGIVVSMANPDALEESIKAAVAAGIPVITINSGADRSKEFGALAHVGQTETVAGEGAGEQLKTAGVTKLLCVIHEAGNVGLTQRCDGAKTTVGGSVEELQVDIANLADASAKITAKLQADSSINGVLTLNPGIAIAARDAIKDAGSSAKLATFDLSGDVIDAINNDEILFAVDQQQYLQGYLPVVFLYLYKTNLNTVGGGLPVLTGPGFVTKDNAAQVAELAQSGTR